MTQTARKGKLYQLQYLIDLSCFIISHVPVLGCSTSFASTKLIYSPTHNEDNSAGTHRFARQAPISLGRGWKEMSLLFFPHRLHTLTTSALIAVVTGGIGTILVLLIMARKGTVEEAESKVAMRLFDSHGDLHLTNETSYRIKCSVVSYFSCAAWGFVSRRTSVLFDPAENCVHHRASDNVRPYINNHSTQGFVSA